MAVEKERDIIAGDVKTRALILAPRQQLLQTSLQNNLNRHIEINSISTKATNSAS